MNNLISKKIVAILFFSGDSLSVSELATRIDVSEEEIVHSMNELQQKLQEVGLSLNTLNNTYSLTTHADVADFINVVRKKELQSSLSPAAIETLALILYRQPIRKIDIDYIRGVNSQFILRNLFAKGLITREKDHTDERSHIYKGTLALLEFLGVEDISKLPDYEKIREELSIKEDILHQEDDEKK